MNRNIEQYIDPVFLEKYRKAPLLHPYVVFPALLRTLGDVTGKKILDLGCGAGDFSFALAQRGAHVTGVDVSAKWIEICQREYRDMDSLTFFLADGADLGQFVNKDFDYVVMNMVLLNVPGIDKVAAIFREVSRVLKDHGRLIFSDLHPLALMIPDTRCEFQTHLPGFSYFTDGSEYKSRVILADHSQIEFQDIHWTLGTYTRCLREANMCIDGIIEPQPVEDAPPLLKDYRIPEHIIFICGKHREL